MAGQISRVFPGLRQTVRKSKPVGFTENLVVTTMTSPLAFAVQIFDVKVHGKTPNGIRLLARQYNSYQEVGA